MIVKGVILRKMAKSMWISSEEEDWERQMEKYFLLSIVQSEEPFMATIIR